MIGQVLAQRAAFVGHGRGEGGHAQSFFPTVWLMEVKVSQTSDFGTVVNRFPIDVQDQLG